MKKVSWGIILLGCCLLYGCNRNIVDKHNEFEKATTTAPPETSTAHQTEAATEKITEEATEEATTVIPFPEETQIADEELNAIQRVLFNLDEFIDTEDGVSKKAEELRGQFIYEYDNISSYCFNEFVYQDLNGDGIKEVVVEASPGYQYVFYTLDGQIYMDKFTFKGMYDIRDDGTYLGDSGAAILYYSRIVEFNTSGATEKLLLLIESNYDLENKYYLSWDDYNNNTNAIPEETAYEIDELFSDVKAEVYEFNRYNIETVLADFVMH